RRPHPAIAGFPLQLRLFTEIELVKILVNSFFNDFNLEKAGFAFNADLAKQAHEALNSMQSKRQTMPVAGVTEDDVVELWDYLRERYPWSVSALEGDFLPRLVELAPWLAQEDRAGLFSFL